MFYALKDIAEKLAHTGKVEPADSTISSQLILSGSSVLRILYLNMGFGVPSAHRLVFGTETGLLCTESYCSLGVFRASSKIAGERWQ